MMKTTTILAAAMTITLAAISIPTKVEAQSTNQIIGGVLGGIAAGVIISGAAGPGYYAAPPPPPPGYGGGCFAPHQVWSNRYQTYVVRNVPVPCY